MIKDIINQLRNTNSRLEKEKILSDNKDNEIFRKVLYLVYEPKKLFFIQKIHDCRENCLLNFEDIQEDIFKMFDDFSNRIHVGNTAKDRLINVCCRLRDEDFDIVKCILNKDLKCGINTKTIQKVFGNDFISNFSVQLANKYDPGKNYDVDHWYITPKLDGLRCVFDKHLLSRNGKYIYGFEHLEYDLKRIADKYGILFFDGELYSHTIPFQKIQGIVMSNKTFDIAEKKEIKYNIFAVNTINRLQATSEMYDLLHTIKNDEDVIPNLTHINFLEPIRVPNKEEDINRLTNAYIDLGYEGSMLRHPVNFYCNKRSDDLLKVKFMKEMDLEIMDMVEGEGRNKNSLGALICEGYMDGKLIKTEVGSGFTDMDRLELWINKDKYISTNIEVSYQGITDGGESLRFPIFKRLKEDR